MFNIKHAPKVLFLSILLVSLTFAFQILWLNYIVLLLLLMYNMQAMVDVYRSDNGLLKRLLIYVSLLCLSTFFSWYNSPAYQEGTNGLVQTSAIMTSIIKNTTTFFLVYTLAKKKYLNADNLRKIMILAFAITIVIFGVGYFTQEYSDYGTSVNAGYVIISVFLALSSTGNLKHYNLYILIVFALALLSAKRGAIICAVALVAVFLLFKYMKGSGSKKLMIPFVLLLFAGTFNYISSTNENFQRKLAYTEDGGTSGREYIYETLWENWQKGSIEEKIFGQEFARAIHILGMDAHNDWLEILVDQGLVGVVLYIFILLVFIKLYWSRRNLFSEDEKIVLVGGLMMWILKSFMSQMLYGYDTIYYIIAFGFIFGKINRKNL